MANTIKLYHEKTSKGSFIQHILVNGIELSGRSISKSDDNEMYNGLIDFWNDKAQEILKTDPTFAWLNLAEWRSWANGQLNEYNTILESKMQDDIIKSIKEANK